jgi:hypothetical protein
MAIRKTFRSRHFWAHDYLAVSSGNVADDMVQEYIEEQEGENIADNSQFKIARLRTPLLNAEVRSVNNPTIWI